jgi:hypothetical protein
MEWWQGVLIAISIPVGIVLMFVGIGVMQTAGSASRYFENYYRDQQDDYPS